MQSSEIVNRDMSLYNTINKLGLHTLFENKYKVRTIAVPAIEISSTYIAGDSISMRDCIAHIGLNIAGIALDEFLSQDEALEESYKELVQTTEDLLLLEKFINTVREQINQKLYTPEEIKSVFEFSMYQFEHTLESQFIKPIIANLLFGIYKAFSVSHFNHEKTIQL